MRTTAFVTRTTTRVVDLVGDSPSEHVEMDLGQGKSFAVTRLTETLIELDYVQSPEGWTAQAEDVLDYLVVASGPRLTSQGKFHATAKGERRHRRGVRYGHKTEDLPEEITRHLIGPDALRALAIETPEF